MAPVMSLDAARTEALARRRFKDGLSELWRDLDELDSVSGHTSLHWHGPGAAFSVVPPTGRQLGGQLPAEADQQDALEDAPLAGVVDLAAFRRQRTH